MGYTNAVGLYGVKRSTKVGGMSVSLIPENTQSDRELGSKKGLIFHWTAGTYDQAFNGYHYNVVFDGTNAHVVKNLKTTQLGQHLWGRNTGMLGISFSAMRGAVNTTNHAGPYPITDKMIEVAAILGAELCAWHNIDPKSSMTLPQKKISGSSLVETGGTITVSRVTDHATLAQLDGYGPDRWDVGSHMTQVRLQLLQHYDKLKANQAKFQYLGVVKD